MTLSEFLFNCRAILPELTLVLAVCLVLIADMFTPLARSRKVCGSIALLGTIIAVLLLGLDAPLSRQASSEGYFFGTLIQDRIAVIFKLIFLAGTTLIMLFSLRSKELSGYRFGEYYSLLLGVALGACLLASSNNFVLFVLAFETLSMCSYILAAFVKHERPPAEAALKYTLYGAVTSGIMLFGFSYLYGLSGSLNIETAIQTLAISAMQGKNTLTIGLSLILVLVGIGFKMAMVPFHFWCPDVYQGAPTPVTAFLSVVSKAAGFAALIRLAVPVLNVPLIADFFSPTQGISGLNLLFGLLAAVTMTFGNLVAIRQTDVKRLLAYSSIAHAGYLLLGMAVFNSSALEAMMIYLLVYLLMNLGAFWVVILLVNHFGSAEISRFRGLVYQSPLLVIVLFICLISLTGLPPTAGFAAKFILFKVVVGAGIDTMNQGLLTAPATFFFTLALLGVLNSAISLYYYMKIIKVMVFDAPDEDLQFQLAKVDRLYAVAMALPVVLLINFGPLVNLVDGLIPK